MIIRQWLSVLSLTLILAGCAEEGIRLEEDQLKRLVAREKTFNWIGYGFSGTVTLNTDGTALLKVHGLGEDNGQWTQTANTLCVQFGRAMRRARRCATIARLSDGTYEGREPKKNARLGIIYPLEKTK